MTKEQLDSQVANATAALFLQNPLPRPRNLTVVITCGEQVISSHYIPRLREAISLKSHRSFLQKKYSWSDPVWLSIAWDAFKKCACCPSLPQSVNRSKLVHNWLNLGAQRAKFGTGGAVTELERSCPYCKNAEDFTHMLTCGDPRALQARNAATTALQKVLSLSGACGFAVLRAITAWTLTPLEPISINVPDIAIQSALTSQTQIGWIHLFRGFLSLELGMLLVTPTATTADARRTQSIKMISETIMAVQDYTLAIWGSRNEVLHEAGSDSLDIVHAALNQSISQLYSLKTSFSPMLQSYFTLPLAARLQLPPRQRKRWLRLARLATSHSSATGTRQQLLSTYFPYANTSNAALPILDTAGSAIPPRAPMPQLLSQLPITPYLRESRGS